MKGQKQKATKCNLIKKQIETFCIHPMMCWLI